jgi:hypothetical protein
VDWSCPADKDDCQVILNGNTLYISGNIQERGNATAPMERAFGFSALLPVT